MKLTDAQMNKILYYLKQCYEEINDNYIKEDNYIYFPSIEFSRDNDGKWKPI